MKELEILLENYWIIKDEDKDIYHQIKDASPRFKEFCEEKLGYRYIINPNLIKLEKLPGKAEPWMGIQDFDDKYEYGFLCTLLMFLEDKGKGEQFVLSEITDYLSANFPGIEKPDWTMFRHRRFFVKVLRFATEIGMMKVDDGEEGGFMESVDTEVLYESTGLSRYFVRNFTGNVLNYENIKDIENSEWLDLDMDRGTVRRNRVYRRIFMNPAVYSEGPEDQDYLYIKNYCSMLQKDVEEVLGSRLHVHRNGAFVVLDQEKHYKDVFPDNKGVSDITLQLNGIIVEKLAAGELKTDINDIIALSRLQFDGLIFECRRRFFPGWSKEYREMNENKLSNEVFSYMKSFCMVKEDPLGREIYILPIVGKVIGNYPADYKAAEELPDGEEVKID